MITETEQLKRTLEEELRRVKTPADAERVVTELERLSAGKTEQSQGEAAERDPRTPTQEVERAADQATTPRKEVAAVIAETAQQTASTTKEGEAAVEAAQVVLAPADAPWGAELLKEAILRRLGPLQALDAKIFLAINRVPHPAWGDRLAAGIATWTNGGWIWCAPLLIARAFGVHKAGRALVVLLPCMAGATGIVEYPIKAFFRRRRPFIDVVRALVVGKKPGSWSFPSGHTASSFGAAWILCTIWPRLGPIFLGLAAAVGFSRIYVGAHYPGDVTLGAFAGMTIAELLRQALKRSLLSRSHLWP